MKLEWLKGGSARLIDFGDGDRAVLVSTVPSAPGTPLEGLGADGVRYTVKVRTAKKLSAEEGERYRIEGRVYNLSREQRQRLREAVRAAGG